MKGPPITAVAVVLGVLFLPFFANAATLSVPGTYGTIQAAVTAAASGDIIDIAAGIYAENVSISGKTNLTIQGAGVTTIVEPVSGMGFALTSCSNVTFTNLKIHTTGTNAHGIWVAGTPNSGAAMSGLTVQNTTIIVDGYSAAIYGEQVSPAHSGWLIGGVGNSNTITINPGTGVTGDGLDLHDVGTSEVSYNTITLNTPTNSTNVLWTAELSSLTGLTFANNTVSGSSGSEVAILTNFIVTTPDVSIATVSITNNTFSNWGSRALRLGAANGAGTVTAITINTNTFNMTSNTEVIGGTAMDKTGTGNIFNVSPPATIQSAIDSAL